jgi:3-methylcrotonyl-CoA carboxylase alpha subunit
VKTIRRLLIANRGEIACRVIRSAQQLGIHCIAVYSEADRHAAHVALADEAVFIGPPAARLSYLNQAVLLKAAGESTADAIHPGYGFLSENAEFAQAVIDAGMRFIGPSPAAISAMGSKANAKALMAAAGVALVPGYYGERQDTDFLKEQAALVGYPVLIKATAGGGGKGMRRVDEAKDFAAALASCQREALSSFGDAQVLIERYIIEPRHIEVQIFGDQHGKIVSLLERDCSLQRRHQKVIEEAPAPGWSPQKRRAMSMAAIAAARSVQYVGAGTVEFIVDPAGDFFFMEMNTRLQVEHPVTEMILGEDLVAWQLKVAMGEPLPAHWEHVEAQGHAIEARLYAENPRRGFLPSMGQVQSLCFPEAAAQFDVSAPIRIDAGIREGDVISGDYDPMIAKIIVHGKDRQQALASMRQALAASSVLGPSNNRAFLQKLIDHPAVQAGQLSTALIEREIDSLAGALSPQERLESLLAIAAAWALSQPSSQSWDAFDRRDGWRYQLRLRAMDDAVSSHEEKIDIQWLPDLTVSVLGQFWRLRDGELTTHPSKTLELAASFEACEPMPLDGSHGKGLQAQSNIRLRARLTGLDKLHIMLDLPQAGSAWQILLEDKHAESNQQSAGGLLAPMPGKIIAINASQGDGVEAGQVLLVMEAMKMEHSLVAPFSGQLIKLAYGLGDQVPDGALIAQIEKAGAPAV